MLHTVAGKYFDLEPPLELDLVLKDGHLRKKLQLILMMLNKTRFLSFNQALDFEVSNYLHSCFFRNAFFFPLLCFWYRRLCQCTPKKEFYLLDGFSAKFLGF